MSNRIFRPAAVIVSSLTAVFVLLSLSIAGPAATAATATTAAPDLKKEIENKIVQVQQGAAPKLKVGPASCPAKLAGAHKKVPIGTYTCTVRIEGVSAPYTVVVKEGGFLKGGIYSIAPAKAIIDLTKVVGFVRENLDESEASTAKVVCGTGVVLVVEPNTTIVCTVTVPTRTDSYTFVVKDVNGTIALRSAPGSSTTKPGSSTTKPGSATTSTAKK